VTFGITKELSVWKALGSKFKMISVTKGRDKPIAGLNSIVGVGRAQVDKK